MKNLALIIILASMTFFNKKSEAQVAENHEPAKLNHIALYATDLDRSKDFYQSLFNLTLIEEPFKVGRHVWFSLGGSAQLHLIKSIGEQQIVEHAKSDHLCFSVRSIEAFIEKLKLLGIKYEDVPGTANMYTVRVDGVKQIYLQDPDGHWLEVNDDW